MININVYYLYRFNDNLFLKSRSLSIIYNRLNAKKIDIMMTSIWENQFESTRTIIIINEFYLIYLKTNTSALKTNRVNKGLININYNAVSTPLPRRRNRRAITKGEVTSFRNRAEPSSVAGLIGERVSRDEGRFLRKLARTSARR